MLSSRNDILAHCASKTGCYKSIVDNSCDRRLSSFCTWGHAAIAFRGNYILNVIYNLSLCSQSTQESSFFRYPDCVIGGCFPCFWGWKMAVCNDSSKSNMSITNFPVVNRQSVKGNHVGLAVRVVWRPFEITSCYKTADKRCSETVTMPSMFE